MLDQIPAELRERPQWVLWRLEQRDGKPTKAPYRAADPRELASTTDPRTWSSFEEAVAAADHADGVGFVFTAEDPFVGVDLDEFDATAAAIVLALDSYTESSVSGRGAHVILRGALNGGRNRKGPLEIYDRGRYFVMTGKHLLGTPTTIEHRQKELEAVLAEFLPAAVEMKQIVPAAPVDLDDRELLERMFASKHGDRIQALWDGETGGYQSHSEADMALCNHLAFWTGRDAGRMDALFRQSGLMRSKWNRLAATTIEKAIATCAEVYSEPTRGQKSVESEAKKADSLAETERNRLTDSALEESVCLESVPPRDSRSAGTDSDPESVTGPGRPFSLPIRDFIALERERRDPLLADVNGRAVVGRASLVLAGALGGHGKTTFFVDLGLHLAAGVDYPPWTVPRPVSILMIENEGPEELFAEKLEARLASFPHELKARLDVCTVDWGGFSLADPRFRERLTNEIADKGYDLIFGDPLDSLGIAGVGSPEDTREFLALMKETGLNKSVAWWLNTHPRKEETKEALNEIAGAWGGKPDSVFLLRLLDDDRTRVRQPKLGWAKRGKGPTLLFAFDPETEAFALVGEESEDERDYLAEITRLLSDDHWRIPKEIAAPAGKGGIGANVDTVKQVLTEHPDVFESRTGEEAKALGRSALATVWGLSAQEAPAA